MPTPIQSSYNASLEQSAQQLQMQMWRAAQTVRAHVPADAGLALMLDCLGLSEARRPGQD